MGGEGAEIGYGEVQRIRVRKGCDWKEIHVLDNGNKFIWNWD